MILKKISGHRDPNEIGLTGECMVYITNDRENVLKPSCKKDHHIYNVDQT